MRYHMPQSVSSTLSKHIAIFYFLLQGRYYEKILSFCPADGNWLVRL
ncbi:hypothetical protein [Moraxella lacunata]